MSSIHSARQFWHGTPSNILLIKRPGESTQKPFLHLINYLVDLRNLNVHIEELELAQGYLKEDEDIYCPKNQKFNTKIKIFNSKNKESIDLIVCLGGDGTLLYVSSLFQTTCPPVVSFNFGSLGFLWQFKFINQASPFDFEDFQTCLNWLLKGDFPLVHRSRLSCSLETKTGRTCYEYLALNEVVVNRGSNYCLTNLDIYVNKNYLTSVQSDGLVISTPTGSTAYAMSTGASLCHPSIQALTISSICPHTLTFRPLVLPHDVEINICLNSESRGSAFCSVDGKNIAELKDTSILKIKGSNYPVPTVSRHDETEDWFEGLKKCLNWNLRPKQKPLGDSKFDKKTTYSSKELDCKSNFSKIPSIDYGYISQRSDDSDYQE